MPAFLYRFGYEHKDEMDYNRRTGSDLESSTGVFIDASSEEEALAWGREISEAFMRHIHTDPSISWRQLGYAHWIESDPSDERMEALPLIFSESSRWRVSGLLAHDHGGVCCMEQREWITGCLTKMLLQATRDGVPAPHRAAWSCHA